MQGVRPVLQSPEPAELRRGELGLPIAGETFNEAVAAIADRVFLSSRNHAEQHWVAVRQGAHPDLLEFERIMLRRMAKLGVPMFVHECVRSAQRQGQLKAAGFSRAGPGASPHQYGCAIDLIHGTLAWKLTPRQWEVVHHVGEEVIKASGLAVENFCMQPGTKLDGFDPAHWQVADWNQVCHGYPFA